MRYNMFLKIGWDLPFICADVLFLSSWLGNKCVYISLIKLWFILSTTLQNLFDAMSHFRSISSFCHNNGLAKAWHSIILSIGIKGNFHRPFHFRLRFIRTNLKKAFNMIAYYYLSSLLHLFNRIFLTQASDPLNFVMIPSG